MKYLLMIRNYYYLLSDSVMEQQKTAEIYKDHFKLVRNNTEEDILVLLMQNRNLSTKQIARRIHRNYKTTYEELQDLKNFNILIKDKKKKYSINPEYGKYLVFMGMRILCSKNNTLFILRSVVVSLKKNIKFMGQILVFISKCVRKLGEKRFIFV
ncbi:MAG: hypothetical protein PHS34_08655 [Candidatus Omnitrophica bacterium]|nr:hypothetical protein [Candidatus Nanoarchaeia archaeon]MDD5551316.1 hypothetical protein [Candidatus Omnitrophota bacterium]